MNEKIIEIIEEYIIEDNQVIEETDEYRFARGLVNSKLKQIIERINGLVD